MTLSKIRSALRPRKEGLPAEAFAIVEDLQNPQTWKLPHHTRAIYRALTGRLPLESTVDWDRLPAAVAAVSPEGFRGRRVEASPQQIKEAAHHLAMHYRHAGHPLPDTLKAILA